ncbi:TPA: AAA family ATPase [Escherichia coli]|nr:AAA family ATPase [Escherichia coli]
MKQDIEASVIGGLLIGGLTPTASDVLATLEPEAFSIPLYRKAFEVIRKQARNRNLIDALMVAEACGEEHFTSILMTSKNCPSAANLKGYAGMVADNYHRRLVLEIMDEMREPIQSGTIDASSQAMDELVKRLSAIRKPRDEVKPVRLGEIITDYTDTLDRRLRNGEESDTLKTGIEELDAITGGMNAEDLVIIAARPGMGKTELALKIAEGVASRVIPGSDVRRGVLIFSMEMSALQIAERSIANAGRMPVSGFTQYELGSVRDITRLRGRYAWSKDGTDSWFITDLEDESHPDRYSAQYRAESQPDGIIGIGTWRDFIVCFGSSTIEYFSLTGATTVGAALYVAQPSLMVQKGIAGTYCKTPFADSYAFISNPATGAPSVYIIGSGQVSPIASASIEKILRSYTADELADGVMESLRFDAHELLIIHLPRHVLVYDASSSANGPQWCVLKTGLYDDVYRAIDFIYEGNQITCGDKLESVIGKLQFDISSQYGLQQEHLLFTPLFKAENARCFDLEVESSTGVAQYADRLFLSATTDGINYGREQMIEQNEPFVYDKRVLWKRVGRIRKNVGFKLRVITKSPVTLSGCQIRIE